MFFTFQVSSSDWSINSTILIPYWLIREWHVAMQDGDTWPQLAARKETWEEWQLPKMGVYNIISFLLHRVYNNDCVGMKIFWKWHKFTIKDKAILQHKLLKIQWHKWRVFLPYQWFNKTTFNDFLTTNFHIHDFYNSNLGTKSSTRNQANLWEKKKKNK